MSLPCPSHCRQTRRSGPQPCRWSLSGQRRLLREDTLVTHASAFLPYPRPIGDGTTPRTLVYITQEYPPGRMGGIGRFVHQLARDSALSGSEYEVGASHAWYGDRWAPLLITWDEVSEHADLAADVAGLGGSTPVVNTGASCAGK